ncbi:MAG TPA: hypothetical protein VGX48_16480 [Pyrinomonadaceae bacterium]|jgi:hypothetical protein|nr:hypothetical protein [Pyrinomonadaceae bacterium]
MKRLSLILVLAAVSVPAAAKTTSQTQPSQAKTAQADARAKKDGTDCSPQRAGVRCSRPKPKKVWFWGK